MVEEVVEEEATRSGGSVWATGRLCSAAPALSSDIAVWSCPVPCVSCPLSVKRHVTRVCQRERYVSCVPSQLFSALAAGIRYIRYICLYLYIKICCGASWLCVLAWVSCPCVTLLRSVSCASVICARPHPNAHPHAHARTHTRTRTHTQHSHSHTTHTRSAYRREAALILEPRGLVYLGCADHSGIYPLALSNVAACLP